MTLTEIIILAIIQGITEFLPIYLTIGAFRLGKSRASL